MSKANLSDVQSPLERWPIVDVSVICLLVITIGWTYSPVLGFEFLDWDDPQYVTANHYVMEGLSPKSIAYALTTFDMGNWIPITWLSLELDATLFGITPAAFHGVNLLWHIINSCLVYIVLRRMTQAVPASAVVALLFGVHPLHVESVAWVSERKDVLSTFWLLVTLLAYDWYVRCPSRQRMMVIGVTMTLGLLSKPMLVTVPVLLLLLDVWILPRTVVGSMSTDEQPTLLKLVAEKTPLFCIAIIDGLVTISAQQSVKAVSGLDSFPFLIRLGNAVNAYGWYLWKTIWPTALCANYSHPGHSLSWRAVLISAVSLLLVSGWVWRVGRQRPLQLFGWLWFLVSLLPVIGLLQVGGQAYADRYSYVPHIGLLAALVWEAQYWLGCRGRTAALSAAVMVTACFMMLARWQLETWRNSEALWTQVLRIDSDNPVANYHLGDLRTVANDLDGAERHYQTVLVKFPDSVNALVCLSRISYLRRDWEQAYEYTTWALRIDPADKHATNNLAVLQQEHPMTEPPIPHSQSGPEAKALNKMGLQDAQVGNMPSALEHFLGALAIDASFADAHNNAALTLIDLHRHDDAQRHFEQAILHAPDRIDFRFNFARFLESKKNWNGAREQFEAILGIKPGSAEAQTRLFLLKRRLASRQQSEKSL